MVQTINNLQKGSCSKAITTLMGCMANSSIPNEYRIRGNRKPALYQKFEGLQTSIIEI